jgi:hypothetical protein
MIAVFYVRSPPFFFFITPYKKINPLYRFTMATLYSSLKALLSKNETINLPEVFNKVGIDNQQQGEDLFKKTIERLVKMPYGKNAKAWARTIKGNGYAVSEEKKI